MKRLYSYILRYSDENIALIFIVLLKIFEVEEKKFIYILIYEIIEI